MYKSAYGSYCCGGIHSVDIVRQSQLAQCGAVIQRRKSGKGRDERYV